MINDDDEPEFYSDGEEDQGFSMKANNKNKSKKVKKEIRNADFTMNDYYEQDINENSNEKKNKKRKNNEGNRITDEIEGDKKSKKRKNDELNNSRDYNDENEDNEPDFYAQDDENDDDYQLSDSDDSNDNNLNIHRKKLKNKNELKKPKIDINNIYEINNKFNYNKDNPVFYVLEDKKSLNYYPKPLSTKKLVEIINKNNISYESLKVKLVDLFEFISSEQFSYVDFIYVLKPGWTFEVTYSKIFLELFKTKSSEKGKIINNIKMKEDKKDSFSIDISCIKNNNPNDTVSFSNFYNDNQKNKDKNIEIKKEEKKENKKEINNKGNKNKKKGRKKGEEIDIKTNFIYDDD